MTSRSQDEWRRIMADMEDSDEEREAILRDRVRRGASGGAPSASPSASLGVQRPRTALEAAELTCELERTLASLSPEEAQEALRQARESGPAQAFARVKSDQDAGPQKAPKPAPKTMASAKAKASATTQHAMQAAGRAKRESGAPPASPMKGADKELARLEKEMQEMMKALQQVRGGPTRLAQEERMLARALCRF